MEGQALNPGLHQMLQLHATSEEWRARLIAAQRPSLFDRGQFYVPWEDISRIVAPANIGTRELQLLGLPDVGRYEALVTGRYRILCTLIYCRLTHYFTRFCHAPKTVDYQSSWAYPLDDLNDPPLEWSYAPRDELLPIAYKINDATAYLKVETHRDLLDKFTQIVFSEWKLSEVRDFYDGQWRFNAPLLTRNRVHELATRDEVYHPRTVFPFDSEQLPKTTPFSKVWKIHIHPSHIVGIDGGGVSDSFKLPFVALKESVIDVDALRVNAEVQEAINERRVHSELSKSHDKITWILDAFSYHLTELRFAFQRENTHYMIFPWATGGSLGDFWLEKNPRDFLAGDVRRWMEGNIIGLLGAIHLFQELGYSHGDLKPDNILVFTGPEAMVGIKRPPKGQERYEYYLPGSVDKESLNSLPAELGVLKITDFGTVRGNSSATVSRTKDANALTGAQRYAPPEFDRNELEHHSPRSRLYDSWSMGCILLEFIIWACYGGESVRRFSNRLDDPYPGHYWIHGENKQKVIHPAVRHQFRKLERYLRDGAKEDAWLSVELREYLHRLLEMVRTELLIVNTDKNIPAIRKMCEDSSSEDEGDGSENEESNCRALAHTLHKRLFDPDAFEPSSFMSAPQEVSEP